MNKTVHIFGININVCTKVKAVNQIADWLISNERICRYVVTPNVDHVVKLSSSTAFKAAYEGASLVLVDGKPIVAASKILDKSLPETIPGSDLVPLLFEHFSKLSGQTLRVYLLGAGPGVAEEAARNIQATWNNIKIVGTYSPPFGFENDKEECANICNKISATSADLLVLGLGAPKQELWVNNYSSELPVKVTLCVGATIDFLAGEKKRAPKWISNMGLEWLHRMASEPKRLATRYMHDALIFPQLFYKEYCLKLRS